MYWFPQQKIKNFRCSKFCQLPTLEPLTTIRNTVGTMDYLFILPGCRKSL